MGSHPHTEAVARDIDRMIELAKNCKHKNTKFVEVAPDQLSSGLALDADTIEVCTNYYCGAIVRSNV